MARRSAKRSIRVQKIAPVEDVRVPAVAAPIMNRLAFERPTSLLATSLVGLPVAFELGSIGDILAKLEEILKDPSKLITGSNSTGTREATVKSWKEHCETGTNTLEKNCPLKKGKLTFDIWDMVTTDDIHAFVTLTWSYDCCNIYDAVAKLDVTRNDTPKDFGVVLLRSFSVPERDPVTIGVCNPCTPKCLRVQLTIIVYAAGIGSVPGIRRQMSLDIELCPGTGGPNAKDNTDYKRNRGDGNGATPDKEQTPYANGTWGVKPTGPAVPP